MSEAALMLEPALKDQLRQAMRGVASSVFLVTTRGPEGNARMTATSACSLSFDPVSVLIGVNRSTSFDSPPRIATSTRILCLQAKS
jgi:flavin reductase (DIM6/NTAB) family NADH-FMN oxidoreductase RutF